jgi:ElaB/YqjD/DUF883 family membrane-anchored ribosome-binding protein
MTSATLETPEAATSVRDRIVDVCRHAAHVSHEARVLKSIATDAVEDGMHAAKQAVTSIGRGVEELGDLRDAAAYRVKRQPLRAVGLAFGTGLVLGAGLSWIATRQITVA